MRREAAAFRWAARGIGAALRTEPHLRFHAAATVVVVVLAAACRSARPSGRCSPWPSGWCWAAELVNTALEALVDLVSPGLHPLAGRVKDVAAGRGAGRRRWRPRRAASLVLGPPLVAWVGAR